MRLATIDLDWLNKRIYQLKMAVNKGLFEKEFEAKVELEITILELVHSQCTPIEEKNKEKTLPKTCLNQWEDKKYCSNEGMCQMCEIN